MTLNLVSTTPSRFTVIRPDLLGPMQVLETIDTDLIIAQRMQRLKAVWLKYDPPNAAAYDVDGLEFDPLKIQAEMAAYFELMVRDRVNQNTRATSLAFASGNDLDAIASRYPGGVPRLENESDDHYRQRIWLSPNAAFTEHGTAESYVFWAMTAPMPPGEAPIRHASAFTQQGTGKAIIALMSDAVDPIPTDAQVSAVYSYIVQPGAARKGLTDWVQVIKCKTIHTSIDADVILFPGVDSTTAMKEVFDAVGDLKAAIRWLGADLTVLALDGAFAQVGVYNVVRRSPSVDVIAAPDTCVVIDDIKIKYAGTGE